MYDLSPVYPRAGKGLLSGRFPTSVALDPQGMHIRYGSGKIRSWGWEDSRSWLILSDMRESIAQGIISSDSAPFRLTRAAFSAILLTEPAGLAILDAARAAGRRLVKRRDVFPRTRVICTVYAEADSFYARVGRWQPA